MQPTYLIEVEVRETLLVRAPAPDGFLAYNVVHYTIEETVGRAQGIFFEQYARENRFMIHVRGSDGLVLVGARKQVAEDVMRILALARATSFEGLAVNMPGLRPHVDNVSGAWFRFRDAQLHASSLHGDHLEQNVQFQEAERRGTMSSISMYHEWLGSAIPVRITSHCGVVLIKHYQEVDTEIEIVTSVFDKLNGLDVVGNRQTRRRTRALTTVSAPAEQRPLPLPEEPEETEFES